MMSKNKLKLIGFAGRKRSGKTTLAKYLKNEENAIIITIADFLKYLCCDLMDMSYEELNEKKDNGYTFDIVPDNRWFNIIDKYCSNSFMFAFIVNNKLKECIKIQGVIWKS